MSLKTSWCRRSFIAAATNTVPTVRPGDSYLLVYHQTFYNWFFNVDCNCNLSSHIIFTERCAVVWSSVTLWVCLTWPNNCRANSVKLHIVTVNYIKINSLLFDDDAASPCVYRLLHFDLIKKILNLRLLPSTLLVWLETSSTEHRTLVIKIDNTTNTRYTYTVFAPLRMSCCSFTFKNV